MKKLSVLCILSFVFCIGITFAYTSDDLANANSLADQQIITKQTVASKYGLDNKILRQEVIAMALKIKGITLPENYKCKKYFSDVTSSSDWVCRAIEVAADNGIITKANKNANPGKYVTRAEALAMLMKAGNIEVQKSIGMSEGFGYYDKSGNMANDWQSDVLETARILEIMKPTFTTETGSVGGNPAFQQSYFKYYGRHNDLATRAEVFGFTASTIRLRLELPSPEIDILYDTQKDSRNWITQTPTHDTGFILYSLIPEGDTLTDWKEKIDKLFLYVDTTEEYDIRDVANGWQGRLKENDENAKVDMSTVNNGVIVNYTSEFLNEKGVLKFLKGTDGVYSLSYTVKLDNHSSEYFKIWEKIVSEAVLN